MTKGPSTMKNDLRDTRLIDTEHAGKVNLPVLSGGVEPTNLFGLLHRQFGVQSSTAVLRIRHWFHMVGIDARSVAAKVIKFQSLGDRTVLTFVKDDVRVPMLSTLLQPSVSIPVLHPVPVPTTCFGIDGVLVRVRTILMPVDKTNGLVFDPSESFAIRVRGEFCSFATSALAQSGRIRRSKRLSLQTPFLGGVAGFAAQAVNWGTAINTAVRLWSRHSLASLTGEGTSRAGASDIAPGFLLSILPPIPQARCA